jgi:hypothetical protein
MSVKPGDSRARLFVCRKNCGEFKLFQVYQAERRLTAEFRLGSKRLAHSRAQDVTNVEPCTPSTPTKGRRQ